MLQRRERAKLDQTSGTLPCPPVRLRLPSSPDSPGPRIDASMDGMDASMSSAVGPRLGVAVPSSALGIALALALGWLVAAGHASLVAAVGFIAGFAALAFVQRGAFIGILTLATLNGIPFLDASQHIFGAVKLSEFAALVLLLVTVGWALFDDQQGAIAPTGQVLSLCGGLLLFWYSLTLARSIVIDHVALTSAVAFSRDFLFFSLFLIFLPRIRLNHRDIAFLALTLGVGVAVFALGQVALSAGMFDPKSLIHFQQAYEEHGFVRVYSSMTDLVNLGLLLTAASLFLARMPSRRVIFLPLTALLLVSVILQATRARWLGLLLGLVLVGCWFAFAGRARVPAIVKWRVLLGAGVLVAFGVLLLLTAPSGALTGSIGKRLLSTVTDVQSGAGTVAIRESVSTVMLSLLGGNWPIGLGFISPAAHYYNSLPAGSIRDSDLGVLNAVMTMGVMGAALVYLPLLYTFSVFIRRSRGTLTDRYAWLRWGAAVWLVATLISSVTLVTLYSTSGLILTAIVLSVALRLTPSDCRLSYAGQAEGEPFRLTVSSAR